VILVLGYALALILMYHWSYDRRITHVGMVRSSEYQAEGETLNAMNLPLLLNTYLIFYWMLLVAAKPLSEV
jgi:hypothetical protein